MSIHASGFMDTQLATTVAFLLNTSVETAQTLINDFRSIGEVDAGTLAIVADLISTTVNNGAESDDLLLPL